MGFCRGKVKGVSIVITTSCDISCDVVKKFKLNGNTIFSQFFYEVKIDLLNLLNKLPRVHYTNLTCIQCTKIVGI